MSELAVVRIEGPLTMHTAAAALARPLPAGDWVLDLAGVEEADSAALALVLEWMRRTRAQGGSFSVRGLPAGLLSLADVYGLDEILPLTA